MVQTARIQYVFLDVVGFTRNRSVEAQSEVVAALNAIVSKSLQALSVSSENTVLLPTGDGIAIALIDVPGVDVHLLLALEILRSVAEYNGGESDVMRQFEVRIGINENIDNVLDDINGRRNVAGAGISMAQRIMDKADGGQVLIGSTVYETLRQREAYMSSFRAFTATGKHGVTFPMYQYLSKNAPGLSVSTPSVFIAKRREPEKLTKLAAYYIAHAITNREFLMSRRTDVTRDYAATILLAFLANDSGEASETPPHESPSTRTWGAGVTSFEQQYYHYNDIEFWPMTELATLLQTKHLQRYEDHFEGANYQTCYWLVKPPGVQKLIEEWPQIANEFGITGEGMG